jgi:chromosome segregation ATPase
MDKEIQDLVSANAKLKFENRVLKEEAKKFEALRDELHDAGQARIRHREKLDQNLETIKELEQELERYKKL